MKIADDQVADLPLSGGRAELLEEIMRTPVLDDRPVQTPPADRRHRWLAPVAAAAAIALLATGAAWRLQGTDASPTAKAPVASGPDASGRRVVLDAPGWTVAFAGTDDGIGYTKGDLELEITDYPAESYDSYVEDRRHIVDPPAAGEPVRVLGVPGQMWAYAGDDHTTIREVQDGAWLEIRARGMDRAAYLALLDRLRYVDEDTFEASLPDTFVTSGENAEEVADLLDGIHAVAGTVVPMGYATAVSSDEVDPYQLGADVAGQVACAWLSSYVDSRRAGDQDGVDEAVRVLGTSRQWPVLQQMNPRGDYPEVVWEYADRIAAGEDPQGYAGALGCGG